ncbi:hypothetical protein C8J56DRAFT_1029208 [Mycena floridula]|nr:hypothetical protein C8J56DRAFT_1029208 [Mycena floridula]
MLKFQAYARTVLRSSWAQRVRVFSSPIPQAGTCVILVRKKAGADEFIDPTTVHDQFETFGRILKIRTQFNGTAITFSSPEQAQKLLDTAEEVTTKSGETYHIETLVPPPPPPPSTHLLVTTFQQNVKDTDIQNAFSKFGPIKNVTLNQERPTIGKMDYALEHIVQFSNLEDAVRANSTLVSLPNGVVVETRMIPKSFSEPTRVLSYFVEIPWNKIRPDYDSQKFVGDLSRLTNVPRRTLEYTVNYNHGNGLRRMWLKAKTIEDARKIKAIPSALLPVTFIVNFWPDHHLPRRKIPLSSWLKARTNTWRTEPRKTSDTATNSNAPQ